MKNTTKTLVFCAARQQVCALVLRRWVCAQQISTAVQLSSVASPRPVFRLDDHIKRAASPRLDRAGRPRNSSRVAPKELILRFVPDGGQRIWRNLTPMKLQLIRDRVRIQSQSKCLRKRFASSRRLSSAICWDRVVFASCMLWPTVRPTQRAWHCWETIG